MMKTLILSSLLLCCALPAVAQHDIYALNARGEVVADSAFIDPFVWINPTVEYEPLYSRTLFTPGLSGSYTVKLYRYKNSENDGGYFSIVEIDCGSKQVLRMIQTVGTSSTRITLRRATITSWSGWTIRRMLFYSSVSITRANPDC